MQPVGPAAAVSEGKGTQLRKIVEMMGHNTHLATIFWEIIHYCWKKQPEVISWVGKSLYHSHDILQQCFLFLGMQSTDQKAEVVFSDL